MQTAATVDEYLSALAPEARAYVEQMRAIIKEEAPDAIEAISYGMPGYKLNGPLVYIGGFKQHVSLFTAGKQLQEQFADELVGYEMSKGTIQFPLSQPLPSDLIRRIVRARIVQNQQ